MKFFTFLIGFILGGLTFAWSLKEIRNSSNNIQDTFTISGGTFDIDIKVVISEDTSFARSFFISDYPEINSTDFDCRGMTMPSYDGSPIYMWLPSLKDTSVLIHELSHVTKSIFDWAGIEHNEKTDEVYSYEIQYLYNQITKK